MKKTLLIAAAALAAGVITSQAQVYSQNIVGYVNIPVPLGYNVIANPLDSGANSLTNIIPPGPTWDFTTVNLWTGTGYVTYTIDSSMSTGVSDVNDLNPVTAPTIKPGQAFFFVNNTAGSNVLTCVGSVHVDAAAVSPQTVGTSTNTLGTSPASQFIGSVIPVGGGLTSALGFPATNSAAGFDYTIVQIPNINNAGSITGFQTYTVDSTMSTGYSDVNDLTPVAEPIIPVGKGFFFVNNTGGKLNWVQSF